MRKNKNLINLICVIGGFLILLIGIGIVCVTVYFLVGDTVQSYDGKIEMSLRNDWLAVSEKGDLNDEADIEISNSNHKSYMIVFICNKIDCDGTYEEYQEGTILEIEQLYDVELSSFDLLKYEDDNKWNYTTFEAKVGGENFYMEVYTLDNKDYYGKVLAWSSLSNKDNLKNDARKMVETIHKVE